MIQGRVRKIEQIKNSVQLSKVGFHFHVSKVQYSQSHSHSVD